MHINLSQILSALLFAGLATGALAAGNHAAGHDHASASIGKPGNAADVTRTIKISMGDNMRYSPSTIKVNNGETVRFILKNKGKLEHEMVLGSAKDLKRHAELMKKNPGMEHDDPNQVSLEPGQTKELIWQFTQQGTVDFACLEPGHMEAGMVGKFRVAAPPSAVKPNASTTAGKPKIILAAAGGADATAAAKPSGESVANEMVEAEVRKIDKEAGKITLKHGEIKKFDMPAMAMVFQVKDPAMLDQVKVGDKVKFAADRINNAFVVTAIELQK